MERFKVGILGCGNIAPAYVTGCRPYSIVDVVACADLNEERAKQFAHEYGLQAQTIDELLADSDIDIIINLTIPSVHAEVSLNILNAGKHVYSEKPLAINRDDGQKILGNAVEQGLRVGCAPDTFLGGGLQTCRKLLDDGAIGRPFAAKAFMASHGPESWHPNPAFFYQTGGGPMLDMGPYYITALVNFFGAVSYLSASTSRSLDERIAGHESIRGQKIPVEINTYSAGLLNFASGVTATMMISFDVWKHHLPIIEIYGTDGTLSVPDPNTFGGTVKLWTADRQEEYEVALTHSDEVRRGIGVAEMAHAIATNCPHRASGELANHVLDVMLAFDESSIEHQFIQMRSHIDRPDALPAGMEIDKFSVA